MTVHYQDARVTLHAGDCLDVLRSLPDSSVDAVVTDPPYGLEFMGKDWDAFRPQRDARTAGRVGEGAVTGGASLKEDGGMTGSRVAYGGKRTMTRECRGGCGIRDQFADDARHARRHPDCPGGGWVSVVANPDAPSPLLPFQRWCEEWAAECLRVLRPGGHLLAFGGTRTWHRLACAVEDAGFEIRDSLAWMHGQGFPKSLDVSKALGDRRCRCETVESEHGESASEHAMRALSDADVPEAGRPFGGPGSVLLAPLSESSAPTTGRSELRPAEDGSGEPRMEGRSDLPAREGQLRGSALREVPAGVPADGEGGRLRDGASSRDGSPAGPLSAALGSGEPHQPRPAGQPAGEPGAVPVERGSQARRGWPLCGRCGKPSVPDGLGTAAKPAFEPVVVARKPLTGTVAGNVLEWGTGALNIDGCRIGMGDEKPPTGSGVSMRATSTVTPYRTGDGQNVTPPAGRWPANVVLDEAMAAVLDEQSGTSLSQGGSRGSSRGATQGASNGGTQGGYNLRGNNGEALGYGDRGGASRFFLSVPNEESGHVYYCICGRETDDACPEHGGAPFMYAPKAPKRERPVVDGVAHPTVKPLTLMRWLVRLVTPPGGTVLEPFAGSGTTVEACIAEGVKCIAIEKGDEYLPLILERIRRQDAARIADEVTMRPDPTAAIAEQVVELGLFDLDEETA